MVYTACCIIPNIFHNSIIHSPSKGGKKWNKNPKNYSANTATASTSNNAPPHRKHLHPMGPRIHPLPQQTSPKGNERHRVRPIHHPPRHRTKRHRLHPYRLGVRCQRDQAINAILFLYPHRTPHPTRRRHPCQRHRLRQPPHHRL